MQSVAQFNRHTSSAFDDELEAIRAAISRMAVLSSAAVTNAMDALTTGNQGRASEIIAGDRQIDTLNGYVEKLVVQTIALRAPMADDLRYLVMAIRVGSLLERAGDHSKSIAKHCAVSKVRELDVALALLAEMGRLAADMIERATTSFDSMDQIIARAVRETDREMNALYAEVTGIVLHEMQYEPAQVEGGMHVLIVAKQLERIGDYASNIANSVSYAVTGSCLPGWEDGPQCR